MRAAVAAAVAPARSETAAAAAGKERKQRAKDIDRPSPIQALPDTHALFLAETTRKRTHERPLSPVAYSNRCAISVKTGGRHQQCADAPRSAAGRCRRRRCFHHRRRRRRLRRRPRPRRRCFSPRQPPSASTAAAAAPTPPTLRTPPWACRPSRPRCPTATSPCGT